jgi:hypothetical protein
MGPREVPEAMNIKIVLALVLVISACSCVAGQVGSDLQQVTLYNLSFHNESRFAINFENGKRGYFGRGESPADFDLMYGGVLIEKDSKARADWLRVADSRSMVVSLGAKNWQDFKETPPFPKPKRPQPPLPLSPRPIVADASAGSREISPYRQLIEVKPGDMYLMRVLRKTRALYVMFRVESLESRVSCVLSFKLVKPPNVDDNEKF